MKTQTLFAIITDIKVTKIRLTHNDPKAKILTPWTSEEESIFFNLILNYGCDFTFLKKFFPSKSRKQILKKYKEICHRKKGALEREEMRRRKEERKAYFDEEILEEKLIKCKNKPNLTESSTYSEPI